MFVTFEGPEGGGKSTAIKAVGRQLAEAGHSLTTTREPGASAIGARVREMLLHADELNPKAELFLFLADRASHVTDTIRPALERGEIVLCDRYADSTLVYQSHARGLDEGFVRAANAFATGGLVPDLTLLFDLDPEEGLRRLQSKDRLDAEPIEVHRRVREGFLREAAREPARWVVLDASRPPEEVAGAARQEIQRRRSPKT